MSGESTRWRVKDAIIVAVQWGGGNTADVEALAGRGNFDAVGEQDRANSGDPEATGALLETANSHWVPVRSGDWIVKGWAGLLFAVDDETFRARYEPEAAAPPADRAALEELAATAERQQIALNAIARISRAHDDGKLPATEAIDLVDSELSVLDLDGTERGTVLAKLQAELADERARFADCDQRNDAVCEKLARIRQACEHPEQVAGTSHGLVVNGESLARIVLGMIGGQP